MKAGLGTVQLGLDYGISNSGGQTPIEEARRILKLASEEGFEYLDTAAQYGESERVIGQILGQKHSFKIITKTPPLTPANTEQDLQQGFARSLELLQVASVYGLMVHRFDDLKECKGLIDAMRDIKASGRVRRIGVSVYTNAQALECLDLPELELIQVPLNAFDQELVISGTLDRLKQKGFEIHARSIFLQGLLLMDPETAHQFFDPIRDHLRNYHLQMKAAGLSALEGAVQFVRSLANVDCAVFGVNTLDQLREIGAALKKNISPIDFTRFAIADRSFLNPALWRLK
ncbi:MAG: aldo/keto reductase [Leptospirales bacterium]|nr:aldo/keto reductase [Leptospirales bacterium]